jgi:hypothetical protein
MVLLSSFGPHSTPAWTIELPGVDEDIGHTLVHYLYTGSYQTLKPQGISGPPDSLTEYKRAALVYCSARLYQLDDLATHAINNMQLFDKELSIIQILDIARDVYPKLLGDDLLLLEYLKTKVEAAYTADNTIFRTDLFTSYIGIDAAFTKALVKIMDQVYTNQIASMSMKKGRLKKMSLGIPLTVKPVAEEPVEKFPPPQGESISYENLLVDEEKKDEEMIKEEEAKELEPELEPELELETELEPEAKPKFEPIVEEEPKVNKFAKLEGLRPDKQRNIWDREWNVVAKVVGGDIKKLALRKAVCDAEGNLLVYGQIVEDVTIELEEPPEVELEPTPAPIREELVFPEPPTSTASCGEPWLEDAVFVMPPSISPNGPCHLRAQHILGDSWENCNKCRTMIREISIQLAQEEGRLNKEIDELLSR